MTYTINALVIHIVNGFIGDSAKLVSDFGGAIGGIVSIGGDFTSGIGARFKVARIVVSVSGSARVGLLG